MKGCLAIKNSQKFATLVGVIFLLYISTPIASDPPKDTLVFQSSAIKVTPEVLNYDNMLIGSPRATTLTITNVSDNDISITPSMDFGTESAAFLDSKLELCNSEACTPVDQFTKVAIPKGQYQEVVVTVTLTGNAPKSFSIAGDLQVIGEVLDE